MRSGYRTVVAWARQGEAERAAYNLDRIKAAFLDGRPAPHEPGPRVRRGQRCARASCRPS